jgi:hypothetical protein
VNGVASVPAPKTIRVLLVVAVLGLGLADADELELEPQAATPRATRPSASSARAAGYHRWANGVLPDERTVFSLVVS